MSDDGGDPEDRVRAESRALRALATSALALPGIAGTAVADAPRDRPEMNYRYSHYREDDLASNEVSPGGTTERYEINTHQIHYGTPFGNRMDLDFNLIYESMSGASPISVLPGPSGPQVVMSGATIEENRTDVLGAANYYFDSGRGGGSFGVSHENDYLAVNLGFDGEKHINDKNTTLLGGLGMSFDTIEPTGGGANLRPVKENKESYSVFAGLAQVINRHLALQGTASYRYSSGYLADPYKKAFVGGAIVADSRPDQRHQVAALVRSRSHFDQVDGTLHADFAYSWDDWGVNAVTLDLAWHQSLWNALQLVPQFRYYSQSQADFYEPFYGGVAVPGAFYSSDYRLSPYGALSYGIKAQTQFRGIWKTDWEAAVSYERYVSDADLALEKVRTANPGLVTYHLIAFRLTGRF